MLMPKCDIQNGPRESEIKVNFGSELWKNKSLYSYFGMQSQFILMFTGVRPEEKKYKSMKSLQIYCSGEQNLSWRILLTFLSRTPPSLACVPNLHLESTVCSFHRLMEKPHCCTHGGLKILSPSLNVKDTQNYACQCSLYPWGEASFSGDAVWECLQKNLSSRGDTELVSHNMEEWVGHGNSEISVTGWILALVSWPVYAKSSIFAPISSIGSCPEHVYTCLCTHISTHIFLWGSIPEDWLMSEIFNFWTLTSLPYWDGQV